MTTAQPHSTDVAATFGRELIEALGMPGDLNGSDGTSIFVAAFGMPPDVMLMRTMQPADFDRLARAARAHCETQIFTVQQVQTAVERTVWHYAEPDGGSGDVA